MADFTIHAHPEEKPHVQVRPGQRVDVVPSVRANTTKTKTSFHILPPVPDAVVEVGEIETELSNAHIGDEPPTDHSKIWIDTGDIA